MIFITHILFALLVCLVLKIPLNFGLVLGATLPDIDYPHSYIGELFKPLSTWINKRFGHRSITHCIYWSLLLGILCFVEPKTITLFIGYSTHVLLDLFTYTGVKLFYPWNVSFTLFEGQVETGKRKDKILSVVFAVLSILALFLQKYIPVLKW